VGSAKGRDSQVTYLAKDHRRTKDVNEKKATLKEKHLLLEETEA